jgi:hypothetical protein
MSTFGFFIIPAPFDVRLMDVLLVAVAARR